MDGYPLTLVTAMRRARREFGDQVVVSRGAQRLTTYTFADCFHRADRLAWALRELGVRAGEAVATLAWNTHEHLEIYIATVSTGAVLHPIDVRLSAGQMVDIIRRAGDVVIFADGQVLDDLAEPLTAAGIQVPVIAIGAHRRADTRAVVSYEYEELLAAEPDAEFFYDEVSERDPAALAYSSATSGPPKGVVYSHRAMYLHMAMLTSADTWAISAVDAVMPILPMCHLNAWGLPFAALWAGARLILPGPRPAAAQLVSLLADATFAAAVPAIWTGIFAEMRRTGAALRLLRTAACCGAAMGPGLLREADELGVPIIHSYGMTEAAPLVLVGRARPGRAFTDETRLKQGYVVPGLDYLVQDEIGGDVPRDGRTPGELLLRGPWIVDRYFRDDIRSREAFAGGWHHTGDIVTIDAAGYIQLVGKKD
jgi:fatty-acyl-CoA synthase